jgi:DUF438 domain-containing protein
LATISLSREESTPEVNPLGIQAKMDWEGALPSVLDQIPVAVTVIDLDGTIRYFNAYAPQILDRKPEHIGTDVRACHREPGSNARIDEMIAAFRNGSRERYSWEVERYGRRLVVTFSPLEVDGQLVGCIHSVIVKPG